MGGKPRKKPVDIGDTERGLADAAADRPIASAVPEKPSTEQLSESRNAYDRTRLKRKYPSIGKNRKHRNSFGNEDYLVAGRSDPKKTRSQRTTIDADLAEAADYKELLRQGEIGLAGTNGANNPGPDSITYNVDDDIIYLNDSQIYWTDEPKTQKPSEPSTSWKAEAERAAAHVDINNPHLEEKIKKAAARRRIERRNHRPRKVEPPPEPSGDYIDIGEEIDLDEKKPKPDKKQSASQPESSQTSHKTKQQPVTRTTSKASRGTQNRYYSSPSDNLKPQTPQFDQADIRSSDTKSSKHVFESVGTDDLKMRSGGKEFAIAKSFAKGLVAEVIKDWILNAIIGPFEKELEQANAELTASRFATKILPKFKTVLEEQLKATLNTFSDPKTYPWPKDNDNRYFCISWYQVTELEMDHFSDVAVWIYRFPKGFAETFVTVELDPEGGYRGSPFWYWRGKKPPPLQPRRRKEFKEEGKVRYRYFFSTSILIWDKKVASLATKLVKTGLSAPKSIKELTPEIFRQIISLDEQQKRLFMIFLPSFFKNIEFPIKILFG